ncbi:MAG TPA: PIN domain-containing protein [Dissulfurispiraceae bacterium]|nr:PIN domain-containing protein [Dissulfurispiraceae bacterium]
MVLFVRALFIVIFVLAGYLYGLKTGVPVQGAVSGLVLGGIFLVIESRLHNVSFGSVLGGVVGLGVGILTSQLLLFPLEYLITDDSRGISSFILSAVLGYSGLLIGLSRGKNMSVPAVMRLFKGQEVEEDLKILDTSVIIDGRIADVIEIGFVEGAFIIPQFILQELQYIADSPDPMRRTKGRRGLDILHRIQKMADIEVRIVEEDFPKIKEVDAKLIALARLFNAKVVTNDFNLSKVAQVQGVAVMNINELANILKPVVLPGEPLNLFIAKEGKEHNQGVAYLDDGTMVVVENARKLIGKNVDLIVTSVLQTTAGRMIFARIKEDE